MSADFNKNLFFGLIIGSIPDANELFCHLLLLLLFFLSGKGTGNSWHLSKIPAYTTTKPPFPDKEKGALLHTRAKYCTVLSHTISINTHLHEIASRKFLSNA
ncbi:MAG: hypothetical protein J0M29_02940 [Chitinophagales bacterium]|nr:hypothetical protein [Chitinophagales bacterium]